MVALDLSDGHTIWRTLGPSCAGKNPCRSSSPGAVTVISGVALSGTLDDD